MSRSRDKRTTAASRRAQRDDARASFLLGAVIGAFVLTGLVVWLGVIVTNHTGMAYSGEVSAKGTAMIENCSTDLSFMQRCPAQVQWSDGRVQRVTVHSPRRLPAGSAIAVEEHPDYESRRTGSPRLVPVTLTPDYPSGKEGAGVALMTASTLIAMVLGAIVGAKVQGLLQALKRHLSGATDPTTNV